MIKETILKDISIQLNKMLESKLAQGNIIDHNLEKGLGNEQALREIFESFLPLKFGVGKGKIVNCEGEMSNQIDIIIYDAIMCPRLFVDENDNLIVPIEGVYKAIEVKTTLTSQKLRDSFENLYSVYLLKGREDFSINKLVTCCPPLLEVFAFNDNRKLKIVSKQFIRLSQEFVVNKSSTSYSEKSPGIKDHTGIQHLIHKVNILGKGAVLQMLSGNVCIYPWNEYTLGMALIGLITDVEDCKLPKVDIGHYLTWIDVENWCSNLGKEFKRKIL